MNYAVIKDGVVINIIVLNEENAADFPDAVPLPDNKAVTVGDAYENGDFLDAGELLLSRIETANQTIAELDALVVALTYQNIQLELGV